jgi:hypothetical protein
MSRITGLTFSLGNSTTNLASCTRKQNKPPQTTHMSNNLTKPAQVRKFILELAKANRHHIFTIVRQESLDKVEAAARSAARSLVMSAPSKGKKI